VEVDADANVVETCRDIDLDPNDPEAGRAACEAASCAWDGTLGLCSDGTFDVAFGLVVSGATEAGASARPGVAETLTVSRNGDGTLQLTWTPDCGAGTLYAVYRGDLTLGYDSIVPEPGQCAVAGTTVTVPEGSGATDFFLVVPSDGTDEGSYGKDSSGSERAPATAACRPQGATDACAQ
jgi:hypothetical protein